MIYRIKACIKHGLDNKASCSNDMGGLATITHQITYPELDQGWKKITQAFGPSDLIPTFHVGNIVAYFYYRTVSDDLPAADFKSVSESAKNLFRCGHVQDIQMCCINQYLYFKANCAPEMKKDKTYKVKLALSSENYDILHGSCECPAGRGSCKHIGAMSFALADFFKLGSIPGFLTCTDKLQQWNHPRGRRVGPVPVDQIGARRRELLPSTRAAPQVYDPRPATLRQPDMTLLEDMRCDLINLRQPCGFLSLLVSPISKIQHDHSYCGEQEHSSSSLTTLHYCDLRMDKHLEPTEPVSEEDVLDRFCLTPEQCMALERKTTKQAGDSEWHKARRCRITGSKCGRILIQKQKTVQLLQFCLYPKPMVFMPKAIEWGRRNEQRANEAYIKHMHHYGHIGLQTGSAGFVVHPEKGWLGASPDGWVVDPSAGVASNGMAEFKCPFTKADVSPEEACKDDTFYCTMVNGDLQLSRSHSYYHQVQLQLYVAAHLSHWCDFCIYTTRGVAVERIYPDSRWQETFVPKMDNYFFEHMLPELVNPHHKPSYYL